MNKRIVWISVILLAMAVVGWSSFRYWQQIAAAPPHVHAPGTPPHHHDEPGHPDEHTGDTYYCPMHPDYVSDKPGNCPICGMKLEKREKKGEIPSTGSTAVSSTKRRILYWTDPMIPGYRSDKPGKSPMGMEMVPVYEEAGASTAMEAGKVEGHTTIGISSEKQQLIGVRTARVSQRILIDTIRAAGRVAYDPELYEIEQEYFEAQKILKTAQESENDESIAEAQRLMRGAEGRLKLIGISGSTLSQRDTSEVDASLLLPKPNRAWVYAEVFQEDLPRVRPGAIAKLWSRDISQPFSGKVISVEPKVNPDTRTGRARILANPGGKTLAPESFLNVEIQVSYGNRIVVPMEALIETGEHQLIFVDRGNGYFEPREVGIGVRGRELVEIRKGIKAGESVVTSANFLIDSESRMKAALETFLEHKH